jgi:hypothetical protein
MAGRRYRQMSRQTMLADAVHRLVEERPLGDLLAAT